jgi:tetratricopeptide (TPR) repeat protein
VSHAHSLRIRCLLTYGGLDEARSRLENDLLLNEVSADTAHADLSRWWLAQLMNLSGRREEAAAHAAELAARPAEPWSLFALRSAAQAAVDANAPIVLDTVTRKLKTITEAYPSTRAASFLLQAEGLREQALGRTKEAITLLARAHDLWPDIANAFRLGQLFLATGAFPNALRLFESVLARKGAAIRWEQQIAWVLSHAAAAQCSRTLHRTDEAEAYHTAFVRYWGAETGLPLVRDLLAKQNQRVMLQ